MGFKGYQGSFPDFLAALREKISNYDDAGKVEFNINNPVVGQELWDEVMGLLAFTRFHFSKFLEWLRVVVSRLFQYDQHTTRSAANYNSVFENTKGNNKHSHS
jgi:hypothetical protein